MSTFELGTDGPRVILVGIDGSETSLRATAYAWGLARRQGSHVVLVYVANPGAISTMMPTATASVIEAEEEIAADIRAQIEHFAQTAHSRVDYTFRTEYGDAAGALAKIADEIRADAVVVGASTQAGHRFIGSVALRLVRAGRWPVTVVP
ncbi:universal stress protein A [Microbispora rosea subsp. aerata]|nr:universal stress protein [Microbispora rosea]GGO11059.1 universal stress protein A [Microbispora rosea subsp. aerata]GIH53592.1 universal stress protein A [Microbispora rosea subsp. aerata]GLJ86277.1 universal stress protein A [Microbispora rosea subsp. aerata]